MQARVDWVLRIFGTQIVMKKHPVRPVSMLKYKKILKLGARKFHFPENKKLFKNDFLQG